MTGWWRGCCTWGLEGRGWAFGPGRCRRPRVGPGPREAAGRGQGWSCGRPTLLLRVEEGLGRRGSDRRVSGWEGPGMGRRRGGFEGPAGSSKRDPASTGSDPPARPSVPGQAAMAQPEGRNEMCQDSCSTFSCWPSA